MKFLRRLLFFIILMGFLIQLQGQSYQRYTVNQLIETKWRYSYMLHLESGMVLHKAEQDYNYFVYFQADYSFNQLLNGRMTKGVWSYSGQRLQYQFKDIIDFEVVMLDEDRLILEFTRANSRGHFQYFFTAANENNPFVKPANELPMVSVKEKKLLSLPGWLAQFKEDKKEQSKKEAQTYINIELVGGGFYGGIDPVSRDIILIKSDGRLIKEYQTKNKGLTVTKKNIPRAELEKFCEFVVSQKFFEFDREYHCTDETCEQRKRQKPLPLPLRISIAYGNQKKVISLPIWGTDERRTHYINYPPALDNIIDAIHRFALRMES